MTTLSAIAEHASACFAGVDAWLVDLPPYFAGIDTLQLALIGLVSLVGAKFMCVGTGG